MSFFFSLTKCFLVWSAQIKLSKLFIIVLLESILITKFSGYLNTSIHPLVFRRFPAGHFIVKTQIEMTLWKTLHSIISFFHLSSSQWLYSSFPDALRVKHSAVRVDLADELHTKTRDPLAKSYHVAVMIYSLHACFVFQVFFFYVFGKPFPNETNVAFWKNTPSSKWNLLFFFILVRVLILLDKPYF